MADWTRDLVGVSSPVMVVLASVAVLSFSLNLASDLMVRNDASELSSNIHMFGRFIQIAVCFICAFLSRKRVFRPLPLLVLALLSQVFAVALEYGSYMAPAMRAENLLLITGGTSLFWGIAQALTVLLFMQMFSLFSPRYSGVTLPFVLALSHICFVVSLYLPASLVRWLKPTFSLCATLGLLFCLLYCAKMMPKLNEYLCAEHEPTRFRFSVLTTSNKVSFIILGMLVFPFLYAFIAELCSLSGIALGLYDVSAEMVGIVVLLILASVTFFRWRAPLGFDTAFIVALPIFATAMLLLPLFWGNEIFLSGFIIKLGYLLYFALTLVVVAQEIYQSPQHSFLLAGILFGLTRLMMQFARGIARLLFGTTDLHMDMLAYVSMASIWVLAMGSLLFALMLRRRQRYERQGEQQGGSQSEQQVTGASGAVGSEGTLGFEERMKLFVAKHQLSKREAEILAEFARGRSIEHIANAKYVSKETVKTHLKRIYHKTDVHNRQELIDGIEQQ
jgi:DNA-binding CsgD family transcriptional regulator